MMVRTGSLASPGPQTALNVTVTCRRGRCRKIVWNSTRSPCGRRRMVFHSIHNRSCPRPRSLWPSSRSSSGGTTCPCHTAAVQATGHRKPSSAAHPAVAEDHGRILEGTAVFISTHPNLLHPKGPAGCRVRPGRLVARPDPSPPTPRASHRRSRCNRTHPRRRLLSLTYQATCGT